MTNTERRDQAEAGVFRPGLVVRALTPGDVAAAARVWHEAKQQAYPYLPREQGRTPQQDEQVFREVILPANDIWVATQDGHLLAFLALSASFIDRLYVQPQHQGRGVGSALMKHAKNLSPAALELFTHQENLQARAFYEKHGFRAVHFGISPPPESEPDVEYHWRPPEISART